jgi:hypothetical protein
MVESISLCNRHTIREQKPHAFCSAAQAASASAL